MNPLAGHEMTTTSTWLLRLLKEELAPYPGRSALVARMVIAATLVMIVSQTFQIPYGAIGAIYALMISRENPKATTRYVKSLLIGFSIAAVDVLVAAFVFVDQPPLRLLWVVGTLFLSFFLLAVLTDYVAAIGFGYLVVITIPLWDEPIPAERRIEGTLWAVGILAVAGIITIALEVVFAEFRLGDPVIDAVSRRLAAVEELLTAYAQGHEPDQPTVAEIVRLGTVGTSRLRATISLSALTAPYRDRVGALVGLAGRLTDIAMTLSYLNLAFPDGDRKRALALAGFIGSIRADLTNGQNPRSVGSEILDQTASAPLLREMEDTVRLIPQVFIGSDPLANRISYPLAIQPTLPVFRADAWSNPDHIRFALKGCLAASLCYLAYNFLFWSGISTAVTTCMLTALTTIGASHQKQVLRLMGALAGGAIAIAAQVFVLPLVDSIAGFTVLFVAVITVGTWIQTSGPRISYFGAQVTAAFCLVNLEQFKIQTSLVVSRDRVAGIVLGLTIMWLVYDRLWRVSAGSEMRRAFIGNLRLLAQLTKEPLSTDMRIAVERSFSLRETINSNLDNVRSLADSVLFEFGPSRSQDLALRDHLRHWQPKLRTMFALRISLLKYRLQLPGFTLPEPMRLAQREFDSQLAAALEGMAGRLEGKPWNDIERFRGSWSHLEQTARDSRVESGHENLIAHVPGFVALSRTIADLTVSLSNELA